MWEGTQKENPFASRCQFCLAGVLFLRYEAHPVSERFPEGQQHIRPPGVYPLKNLSRTRIHPVLMFFMSRQRCLDSFHPRVLIVRNVVLEQVALILLGSRRLKNCKHSTHVASIRQESTSVQTQQQQKYNLERFRSNRRGASTTLWGVESCSLPSRWPNPIPAIPPFVVRTPHLHGAPTTEETSVVIVFFCQQRNVFRKKEKKKEKRRNFLFL